MHCVSAVKNPLIKPGEFPVFPVRFQRGDTADRPAGAAVEESEAQEVVSDKLEGGIERDIPPMGFFALGLHGAGRNAGIFSGAFVVFFHRVVAVVQQVAGEVAAAAARLHFHFIVRVGAGPVPDSAVEQAQFAVGVPAAVVDPLATIIGSAVHGVAGGSRVGFYLQDGLAQRVAEGFVGIQAEYPRVQGLFECIVFLFNVPGKRMLYKSRTLFPANCLRAVGGKRVHNHYVIGYAGECIQTTPDVALLVVGDDDGGEVHFGWEG